MISNIIFGMGLLILFVLLKIAYRTIKIYISYKRRYGDQVKILFYPILGLHYFMTSSLKNHDDGYYFLKKIVKENPKVKAIIVLSGILDFFIANDNEWIKYLSQDQKLFYKDDALFGNDYIFQEGLAFCNFNRWKRQRLFLNSSFHFEALKSRVPAFQEELKNFCPKLKSGDDFLKINCFEELKKVTTEIFTKAFYGFSLQDVKCKNGKNVNLEFYDLCSEAYIHRISSLHFIIKAAFLGCSKATKVLQSQAEKKLLARIRDVCDIVEKKIDEKLLEMEIIKDIQSYTPANLLETYLKEYIQQQKQLDSYKEDDIITKAELVQQYFTFFFAGTDSSAQLTSMSLFEMARNPQIKEKLLKEFKEIGKSSDEIEACDLSKLPYLDAVVKETNRCHSVVAFLTPRKTDNNYQRDDLFIDKNLMVSFRLIQYSDEKDILSDIDKFNPDRFLNHQNVLKLNSFDLIPFSTGERVCIGQNMGIIEVKLSILHILTHFDIAPVPNYKLRMFQVFLNQPTDLELIQMKRIQVSQC